MKGLIAIEMPSKAMGEDKAAELYAADPTCMQCQKKIEAFEEAVAIYFNGPKAWKLVHRKSCAFDSIFAANPKLARRVS